MTTITLDANEPAAITQQQRRNRLAIRLWLYGVCVMILAMVVVGGATRLTESGLSITEWKPIHGVIPPLNEAEWQEEFAKYQQIPEYQLINKGMSLGDFQFIFWWEWAHRLLGRLIGVAFFVPMVWFWARGRVEPWLKPRLVAGFLLGGLQGAVGWWMVASGLAERTDVSQYRLATHLTLAIVIFAYLFYLARRLALSEAGSAAAARHGVLAKALLVLVIFQIFLGGLVAGLNAGLTFNTWPLMDGQLVPKGLFAMSPAWMNFFENVMTVQFQHRMVAYLVTGVVLWQAWRVLRDGAAQALRMPMKLLLAAIFLQVTLGIATLLKHVPLDYALLHQGVAVLVLALSVEMVVRTARGKASSAA